MTSLRARCPWRYHATDFHNLFHNDILPTMEIDPSLELTGINDACITATRMLCPFCWLSSYPLTWTQFSTSKLEDAAGC